MQRIVIVKFGWINFISLIYIPGRIIIKQYNGITLQHNIESQPRLSAVHEIEMNAIFLLL